VAVAGIDVSSLQVDPWPKLVGLAWVLAPTWCWCRFIG